MQDAHDAILRVLQPAYFHWGLGGREKILLTISLTFGSLEIIFLQLKIAKSSKEKRF